MRFTLPESFIETYKTAPVDWGYGALSETVFLRSYSQLRPDGTKERWWETCRRVVEAMFQIQKDHCASNKLPWDSAKAQRSAKDAYDRMFEFKWTPPGRGLARMGTPIIERNGVLSLMNCSAVTTEDFVGAMEFLMDASLLGVGVGYDTAGAGKHTIHNPQDSGTVYVIPDSREGWVESTRKILMGYIHGEDVPQFDYSAIRPLGSPISTGGVAPGPAPLRQLHERLYKQFVEREGELLTITDVVDVGNQIGACVVSGGNRRTALIAIDDSVSDEFLELKNYEKNPQREAWGFASNNSVSAKVGQDLSKIIPGIVLNGEPGIVYPEVARQYGRLIDPPDPESEGALVPNPCQRSSSPVLTPKGISTIGQIQVGDEIWSESGWTTVLDKWSNGEKPVYAYRTTAGVFYGTENHRLVSNGVKIEAKDCSSVDRLAGPSPELDNLDPEDILAGLLVGDGTTHGKVRLLLCIGDDDQDYFSSEISHLIGESYSNPKEYRVNSDKYGLRRTLTVTHERSVPDSIFYGESKIVRGFLRGLYSANGSLIHNPTGRRVTLKASSFRVIEQVQIMLSSVGIHSYYTTNKEKSVNFDNGVYVCKQSYDLNITTDIELFESLIGFIQGHKSDKLQEMIASIRRRPKPKKTFDIVEVETLGSEEVFDITVDNATHTYWTGGLNVSNCGEIMLKSAYDKENHKAGGETCNLSDVNMNKHTDLKDFLKTIKWAFLYNKTVTLIPSHNELTNSLILKNRRIGCSLGGVADFIDNNSLAEFRLWADEGYKATRKWDKSYSEWFCTRESVRVTTIKPSGCRPADGLVVTDQGILSNEELFWASGHQEDEEWSNLEGYSAVQDGKTNKLTQTFDNGKAEVFQVNMTYGMSVQSTAEHKWWVTSNYQHARTRNRRQVVNQWVRTDELSPGDIIHTNLGIYNSTTDAPLKPCLERAIRMKGASSHEMTQPTEMTPEIGWFLGYLWGDGAESPEKFRLRFIDEHRWNLEKIQSIFFEVFGLTTNIHKCSDRNASTLEVGSKLMWHWLIKNGVWKYFEDDIDAIPEVVRRSSKETILAFLAGLVDSDGCVTKKNTGRTFMFTTKSARFAKHIQDVGASVGILIGKSRNTQGENYQTHREMWLQTAANGTLHESVQIMERYSNKMQRKWAGTPWFTESDKLRYLPSNQVGLVKSVESLGEMETFDVEVENSHWYYAGAFKSHNTTSTLCAESPGVHWNPGGEYYARRAGFTKGDPILDALKEAGYPTEQSAYVDTFEVVEFPVHSKAKRSDAEVSAFEKMAIATECQTHWADNAVSCTVSFDPETEGPQLGNLLQLFDGKIKGISFLPRVKGGAYKQMPYESITEAEYLDRTYNLKPLDLSALYDGHGGAEAEVEQFCTTDSCLSELSSGGEVKNTQPSQKSISDIKALVR